MNQDKIGVWSSPSGARIAWFKDPDGNILSITEG
jgi:predicted enzyme related to lactoylglutathione lyase